MYEEAADDGQSQPPHRRHLLGRATAAMSTWCHHDHRAGKGEIDLGVAVAVCGLGGLRGFLLSTLTPLYIYI